MESKNFLKYLIISFSIGTIWIGLASVFYTYILDYTLSSIVTYSALQAFILYKINSYLYGIIFNDTEKYDDSIVDAPII